MAGTLLQNLSQDDHERARLLTEYKSEVDYQSKMVDAKRDGIAEGIEQGIAKGMEQGKLEIAKAMLLDGDTADKVARVTGLDPAKIQLLKKQI